MAKKERREGPPPTTRFVAPPPVPRPHKPGARALPFICRPRRRSASHSSWPW